MRVTVSEIKCSRALWFLGQQVEAQRDSLPPHMRAEMLPGTGGGGLVFRFSRATGGVGH